MQMTTRSTKPRLTQYSSAGGCGCKIQASELNAIVGKLMASSDYPGLLLGIDARDDAAVIRLPSGDLLALTIDAFTPVFDDPATFGRVAACNALSDIYAMGMKPILAQGFLGWPVNEIGSEWATEVLRGASEVCQSVGLPYAGGHSISTVEPIFGLCVNGLGSEATLKTNAAANAGDLIYLTKPLGGGVISTAEKKNLISASDRAKALEFIAKPNSIGVDIADLVSVNAMTDVTGFGLAGHLSEMLSPKKQSAIIHFSQLRVYEGVKHYFDLGCETSGGLRNRADFEASVKFENGEEDFLIYDPQTNGGLLVAIAPEGQAELEKLLRASGYEQFASPIGRIVDTECDRPIEVV